MVIDISNIMVFSTRTEGVFSCDVDCSDAERCQNMRCLYKQKTLGVHIWYMGDYPYHEEYERERAAQLALREELGPWYQPELTVSKGTNCHTVWCRDFIPPDK